MVELALGVAFIAGTVLATLAVYALARWLFVSFAGEDTKDLAGSVIFRVSALHGLILALVFAQELQQYSELRVSTTEEASAVADIWNGMERMGAAETARVQSGLSAYLQEVIGPEWQRLSESGTLSAAAWAEWEKVYEVLLDLPADTPREVALRSQMLAAAQEIAGLRDIREVEAIYGMSAVFWVAAVAGVVLVTLPYFTFPPTTLNLTLLGIYGAYTGLVMYLIFAFANPYGAPGRMPPAAFERLLDTRIGGS